MSLIGVIGGSGLYEIPGLDLKESKAVNTPFGEPSGMYRIGEISGIKVAFLPRHGTPHSIPPHKINYRANIWGFRELGATAIISISASGGINTSLKPSDIVVLDQIIDMTGGSRAPSFYDGPEVIHIDFTEPYCPELRTALLAAGKKAAIELKDKGTYVCVCGPRLESRAEIFFFSRTGADVIGMTGMPEAGLARELGICFSGVSVVTNYAAGISKTRLTADEVLKGMEEANEKIKTLLRETFPLIPAERTCECKKALKNAKM